MQMFIAALFVIIKNWKRPSCLPHVNDKQIVEYPNNGILLSKNERTWMNRKIIVLSKSKTKEYILNEPI